MIFAALLFLSISLSAAAADKALTFDITVDDYRIVERENGQIIEVSGYDYLMVPGRPKMPARNFMIALPPGAVVNEVEVIAENGTDIPGAFNIVPTAPIMPASASVHSSELSRKLKTEWERNYTSVYSRNLPYPFRRGKLHHTGTLRKYAYVSVVYYPFSYYPQSGRLVFYDKARIVVDYTAAEDFEKSNSDLLADGRAGRLFVNFDRIGELYCPTPEVASYPDETWDYVIITEASLVGALEASGFVGWKTSLGYNLKTVLLSDPEISGQPGTDLAEKIRNFLRAYYIQWNIEYVLLIGDIATVPMRLCYPDSSVHTYYPDNPGNYGGAVPTDAYYADLSYPDLSSWDSDGDGYYGEYGQDNPDFLPEIYVGRIPVSDSSRIFYTLQKSMIFEQDTGLWKNRALHPGAILFFENQNYSGYPFVDGARVHDTLEKSVMNGWTISHYSEQEGIVVSDYPWPALTYGAFVDEWRNGQYGVVNWSGHGWVDAAARTIWQWDDGDGVMETDGSDGVASISFINDGANLDDDYPSLVFAISCYVGYPEPNIYGNLGVDLLTYPGFGAAVGVLSATRPAAVSAEGVFGGGAETMCYQYNRFMIDGPGGPEKVGQAFYNGKFYSHQHFGWDHIYEFQNMFNYNLYGDPALIREGIAAPVCGDTDANGSINILDVTLLLNYLYLSGPAPQSIWAADPNGDAVINILDITFLIDYIYLGGPEPSCR